MEIQSGRTLAINGVTADFGSDTLCDKFGYPIDLRPQAFAVLRYLVEHADCVVAKHELMQAVWPGIAVTDDSLVQCIHEIRRALRDEAHTVLRTVPKRGYRLVLPAKADSSDPAFPPPVSGDVASAVPASGARGNFAGLATAVVAALLIIGAASVVWLFGRAERSNALTAGPPVIAVLPFGNLDSNPDQAYFADGITEDLITDLSKFSGILVIARNSTWAYKGKPIEVRRVAEDLGARYVLEGSVRRQGDQVRINAQLTDAVSGRELWADRYDGTTGNVFALQDKVIGQIVAALAVKLTSAEQAAAEQPETTSSDAYDAVLKGWEHYRRNTEEDTKASIALFEKAIKLDPSYSRAHAALAAASWRVAKSIWPSASGGGFIHAIDRMNDSLANAMRQPNPLAYAISAEFLARQGRYDEAFAEIARATALAPNDPDILISKAWILNAKGRAPEAEAAVRRAMRLDPHFPPEYLRVLAISLLHQERYEEAVEIQKSLLNLQSDLPDDYATLVVGLGHLGRLNDAAEAIKKFNELSLLANSNALTVQMQGLWWWHGDLFDYDPTYRDRLADGLRRAGVQEGAGTDIPFEEYRKLVSKSEGDYNVTGATKVSFETAKALHDRGVIFIDVRAAGDFSRGHIPGAYNLDVATEFSKDSLSRIVGMSEEVVLSCHGKYCNDSTFASAKAVSWGFTHVYYFAGGFPAWKDAGYPVEASPAQSGSRG